MGKSASEASGAWGVPHQDYEWLEIMRIAPRFVDFEMYCNRDRYPWLCASSRRLKLSFREFLDPRYSPLRGVSEVAVELYEDWHWEPPETVVQTPQWPQVQSLTLLQCDVALAIDLILHHVSNVKHLSVLRWGSAREDCHVPIGRRLLYQLETLVVKGGVKVQLPRLSELTQPLSLLRALWIGSKVRVGVRRFGDDTRNSVDWFERLIWLSPHLHTLRYNGRLPADRPDLPNIRSFRTLGYNCCNAWIAKLPNLETFAFEGDGDQMYCQRHVFATVPSSLRCIMLPEFMSQPHPLSLDAFLDRLFSNRNRDHVQICFYRVE